MRVARILLCSLAVAISSLWLSAPALADTHVTSNITTSTIWDLAGSPYILDSSISVSAGATLTISPGVVVKFNGQTRMLTVNGTLSATGAGSLPITFTSIQDDTVGGDSNGDGGATQPAPGQWYGIRFTSTSTQSRLWFTDIRYGGWGSSPTGYGAVQVSAGSPSIEYTTIIDSQRSAITVGSGASPTIRYSTLARNQNGISANMGSLTLEHSTILHNSKDGVWFNYVSTYAGAAATITDSDVKNNGENGIDIQTDRTLPLAKWPHGNRNNIFANTDRQLQLSGYHPSSYIKQYDVDWTGNFWGDDVYFWYAPSRCLGTDPYSEGHLAYTWSNPAPGPGGLVPPPDGPISWNSYLAGSGNDVDYCAYDRFPINSDEFSPTYIETAGRVPVGQAVADYTPELRYDSQETYRADAADTITDNYTAEYTNRLLDGSDNLIAASDPSYPEPTLTLGFLGSTYPGGASAQTTDHIDEANSYAEDAQRLHGIGAYANKTYTRFFQPSSGELIVQYWFFYYHNPKTYFGFGAHEGDWEMVQVHLDAGGNPVRATYAQHGGGERCDWIHVQRTADGRPIAYIAEGSHATYFSSGYHFNEGADDTANGDGEVVTPSRIDVSFEPPWTAWQGKWGGSDSSPQGPAFQSKWTDPVAWANGVDGCTEGQTQFSRQIMRTSARPLGPTAPPAPRVHAYRAGKRVVILYDFSTLPRLAGQRPWQILTTVDSRGDKYPPLTLRSRVRGRHGVVSQPLGLGHGPFEVLVSARSKNGSRSPTIRVPLR